MMIPTKPNLSFLMQKTFHREDITKSSLSLLIDQTKNIVLVEQTDLKTTNTVISIVTQCKVGKEEYYVLRYMKNKNHMKMLDLLEKLVIDQLLLLMVLKLNLDKDLLLLLKVLSNHIFQINHIMDINIKYNHNLFKTSTI